MRPTISRERALAHASRVALLAALHASPQPCDVTQLADAVGLHVNTVRSHLALLEHANLVVRHSELRTEPGRPRQLYVAAAPPDPQDSEHYRLMARMLASYIATNVADPSAAAEETGRQWGRHLTPTPAPFTSATSEQGHARLIQLLSDLGFAPRRGAGAGEIELLQCPFLDVALAHPEVACSLHLGLMRGALAQMEVPLTVDDLIPFVAAQRCIAHVSSGPA